MEPGDLSKENECNCAIEELFKYPLSSLCFAEKKGLITEDSLPLVYLMQLKNEKQVARLKPEFYTSKYNEIAWLCGYKKFPVLFYWTAYSFLFIKIYETKILS